MDIPLYLRSRLVGLYLRLRLVAWCLVGSCYVVLGARFLPLARPERRGVQRGGERRTLRVSLRLCQPESELPCPGYPPNVFFVESAACWLLQHCRSEVQSKLN